MLAGNTFPPIVASVELTEGLDENSIGCSRKIVSFQKSKSFRSARSIRLGCCSEDGEANHGSEKEHIGRGTGQKVQ